MRVIVVKWLLVSGRNVKGGPVKTNHCTVLLTMTKYKLGLSSNFAHNRHGQDCEDGAVNRISDKSRVFFCSPHHILKLDKTVSKLFVADSFASSTVLFILPTQTRQDNTVLFCPCRWCGQNWRQVKTVFSSPDRISRLDKSFKIFCRQQS